MNDGDIDQAVARLSAQNECLRVLLIICVARLAGDAKTIHSILREVPSADIVRAASDSVFAADLPEAVRRGMADEEFENTLLGTLEKFKYDLSAAFAAMT